MVSMLRLMIGDANVVLKRAERSKFGKSDHEARSEVGTDIPESGFSHAR